MNFSKLMDAKALSSQASSDSLHPSLVYIAIALGCSAAHTGLKKGVMFILISYFAQSFAQFNV